MTGSGKGMQPKQASRVLRQAPLYALRGRKEFALAGEAHDLADGLAEEPFKLLVQSILDFEEVWLPQLDQLIEALAERFEISRDQASDVLTVH